MTIYRLDINEEQRLMLIQTFQRVEHLGFMDEEQQLFLQMLQDMPSKQKELGDCVIHGFCY